MQRIHVLPPEVVCRIAAGEVVERPASVVKELVENSIDAGATEVLVEVEEGGLRRIRVADNGAGMDPEDLPLAFESHATSKLPAAPGGDTAVPDLFGIGTLGFRGEALASVASIAEVEAVARPPGADCAHSYRPGTGEPPRPAAGPPGTSIEVRNLFYNTPARRKFLRSAATELSHVVDQVVRLALGFPGVRFTLKSGGKTLVDCPRSGRLRDRLASVLGREKAEELIELPEPPAGGVQVRGFIGPPHLHRQDARGQHFFVDGRWVRDRVLSHAVQEAYRGFQVPGQRPLVYLFIDVPAGGVDVNVHPTKTEVRFLDSQAVHRAAHGAVRAALEESGERTEGPRDGAPAAQLSPFAPADHRERVKEAAIDFLVSGGGVPSRAIRAGTYAGSARPGALEPGRGTESAFRDDMPAGKTAGGAAPPPAGSSRAVQVLRSYILLENEEGLVLLDQHAVHEKVLFERILSGLREGPLPRQRLLVPEVVELPPELAPLIPEISDRLASLGFEVEPFGPREAAVHSVPSVLGEGAAGPVVLEVARWLKAGGPGSGGGEAGGPPAEGDPVAAEVRRIAQLLACKRAVKAGTKLDEAEIEELLQAADGAEDARYCPHGRPTRVVISARELERRFERR